MKLFGYLLLVALLGNITPLCAQDSTASVKKSYFQTGLKYLSNNVYLGRKDSVALPYITPSLGYFHKSGLFITGSVSYAPVPEANRLDLITLEAGYDFSIKEKFNGGLYADKYFYNLNAYSIKSEINSGVGAYGSYDFGLASANVGAGMTLGSKSDIVTEMGLSHCFYADNGKMEITPTGKFNAGTQNYYGAFYTAGRQLNANKGKGKGKNKNNSGASSTPSSVTILASSQFKVLDYEFSLPVVYNANKFKFSFTPTYAVPVNSATIQTGTTITKEKLSNSFFGELELDYKFGKH